MSSTLIIRKIGRFFIPFWHKEIKEKNLDFLLFLIQFCMITNDLQPRQLGIPAIIMILEYNLSQWEVETVSEGIVIIKKKKSFTGGSCTNENMYNLKDMVKIPRRLRRLLTNPSRCNSTNRQNPPIQLNRLNCWTNFPILISKSQIFFHGIVFDPKGNICCW